MKKPKLAPSLLRGYVNKRNLDQSPEPAAEIVPKPASEKVLHFVIHKHQASRLHYDLRLECEGILRSWAIPRGPSLDPLVNRLSVRVEDHPLRYQEFEAVIPKGNYGAGTMMVWDRGTYTLYENLPGETAEQTFLRQYRKGGLKIDLQGEKVRGRFTLVKIKKSAGDDWLLIKKRDEFATTADVLASDLSVHSGRTMDEITLGEAPKTKARLVPVKKIKKPKNKPIGKSLAALKGCKKVPIPAQWRAMKPRKALVATDIKTACSYHTVPHGMLASAVRTEAGVTVKSATGLNLTIRCREICQALASLPENTVLTGIASLEKPNTVFYLADVLWFDGYHTADLALQKRLAILATVPVAGAIRALPEINEEQLSSSAGIVWQRQLSAPYEFAAMNDTWQQRELRGKGISKTTAAPRPVVTLTNPTKIFWPDEGYTKKHVYDYYEKMAEVMLPHLRDRPQSLNRHPNGITGKSFYQKEVAGSVPGWIETTNVAAYAGTKTVTQLLVQRPESLLYLVNMGCIEINTWLSRVPTIMTPDFAVIDIDPGNLGFKDVIRGAKIVKKLLDELGAKGFCKTSGGRGLHIYLPTQQKDLTFADCQKFAELVGEHLVQKLPYLASTDRSPLKRRAKLYIDALQNRKGQTMASVYSIRPRPGAAVSTPIAWKELTDTLDPLKFNIKTVPQRVAKLGDLWADIHTASNDIRKFIRQLSQRD